MSGCLLQDSGAAQCFGKGCERCGWNREEHRRREILLKCEGLTRCADGLKRLIVGEKLEPAPMAEGLKATPGRALKTCPNCGGMFAGKANQVLLL